MQPVEWQPITGCSYASPGCTNCKTMKLAAPEMRAEFERDGLVSHSKTGPVWTGAVRFSEVRISLPADTIAATEFIVCPHSDLFHENVPQVWIDRVFDEIELHPRHAFQILTKRASRMRDYVSERYQGKTPPVRVVFGVSCERQAEADERIPILVDTPAALRALTLYPLLGPIDLTAHLARGGINIVMLGEEDERPANPAWASSVAEQCASFDVKFYFSNRLIGQE